MYEQKQKNREFWLEIVQEALKTAIDQVSTAIIYKLTLALNGEDFTINMFDENAQSDKTNPYFIQSLRERGLSEQDIMDLQRSGIDLSDLTTTDYEVMD